jgi:tRNA pseudouridine38-40 synthase
MDDLYDKAAAKARRGKPPEGRQIALRIEYDGSAYHGWQRQANGITVQEEVEKAVAGITGRFSAVTGAGRTDAGVHAFDQVASFFTASTLPGVEFRRALNAILPEDIRVRESWEAPPGFHPQFSARWKTYCYLILHRPASSPLLHRRCWHLSRPLDLPAMRQGAGYFLGSHDFSAFRTVHGSSTHPVRTLIRSQFEERGDLLAYVVTGNGFLRNMVRAMVGTLVELGSAGGDPSRVGAILASRDRGRAGARAPAEGLYLLSITY